MVKTIYYADDDSDDLALFETAVHELGHRVKLFDIASALLKSMELPPPPDFVFLDMNMPLISGMEALKLIRKDARYNNTPVVIYSTSGHTHDIEEAKKHGATWYIKKALSFTGIKTSLSRILMPGGIDKELKFYYK